MNPNQKNIQAVLDLSSAADVAEGLAWYKTAHTAAIELSSRYSINVSTACGVIAALSPRNKWTRNLLDAENLINVFCTAGADACTDVKVCTFGKNKAKAIAVLSKDTTNLDDIESILSGPKLKEFFRCIIGQDDVCIDGHAYSIWFGDRITLNKVPSIGVKLRRSIKEHFGCTCVYCGETYELHELTLDHVHPRTFGGEDITSNLVCACTQCNQDKGSTHWRSWMRERFGLNLLREGLILSHIN